MRSPTARERRIPFGWRALAAVTTVLAAVGCSAGTDASDGIAVPLTYVPDTNRLIADVEVGGAPMRVLVDTGSVGLRVVADRVPAAATTPVGPATPVTYGSGVTLTGTVVRAPVRIGPVTGAQVPVELVTATGCARDDPQCPAAGGRAPEMFGGRYDGILGIGVAASPQVPNPLWYLGPAGYAFTVHHDVDDTSELRLGTSPTGFDLTRLAPSPARSPDGPPGWGPRIPACVVAAPLPDGRTCGPTLPDTGSPVFVQVGVSGATPGRLPAGAAVTVAAPDGRWSTTAGPREQSWVADPGTGYPGTIAGLSFFARYDVRFDLDSGTVGLRPREV